MEEPHIAADWVTLGERIFALREQRDAGNNFGQAEEDELDELEAEARRKERSLS